MKEGRKRGGRSASEREREGEERQGPRHGDAPNDLHEVAAEAADELHVALHYRDALGVQGAQVRVLEQVDEVPAGGQRRGESARALVRVQTARRRRFWRERRREGRRRGEVRARRGRRRRRGKSHARLGRLLEREERRRSPPQADLAVLDELHRDLAHDAGEGELGDEEVGRLLVRADLLERLDARLVAVRLAGGGCER